MDIRKALESRLHGFSSDVLQVAIRHLDGRRGDDVSFWRNTTASVCSSEEAVPSESAARRGEEES
jgi:hypothetical protein